MTRQEFEQLTERYKAGKCTPEEIVFVEKWVDSNCRQQDADSLFENEAEAIETENEIWENIQDVAGISPKRTLLWKSIRLFLGGAACLMLVVLADSYLQDRHRNNSEGTMTGLKTYNTSLTRQRIILPDSSVVTLAEGAVMITSESYGKQTRTVHLTGEAFFEIRPDPKMPFLVYSGDLVTEVLGTSFHIKPQAGKKTVEVSVVTGKVSVYTHYKGQNQRRSGVIITPNQKVVYNTELKTIRQDLVDDPKIVVKDTVASVFNFDETSVGTVLAVMQKAYGTEIVVNNPELNHCEFTGNLNGFDLFRQLDYLCDVIHAEYEVRGTTIFLTGNGCNAAR